jgi:hypothetical protein
VFRDGVLRRDGRGDGIPGPWECNQDGIALGLDFVPIAFDECVA